MVQIGHFEKVIHILLVFQWIVITVYCKVLVQINLWSNTIQWSKKRCAGRHKLTWCLSVLKVFYTAPHLQTATQIQQQHQTRGWMAHSNVMHTAMFGLRNNVWGNLLAFKAEEGHTALPVLSPSSPAKYSRTNGGWSNYLQLAASPQGSDCSTKIYKSFYSKSIQKIT